MTIELAPYRPPVPPALTAPMGASSLGLDELTPVSLAELVEHAALLHRTDRKYIVDLNTVRALVAQLSQSHRVLEIAGRRSTTYQTLYFDTADFAACRSHIQGRRRRWKARSRMYVEDGLCRIEVKTKDNRGGTNKSMGPSHPDRYGTLAGDELAFVDDCLSAEHPELDVSTLGPTAEITYVRATLVDLVSGTRVTIDWNLHCRMETGHMWLDGQYALIETKGPAVPSVAGRALVVLSSRPRSFSKYVAAISTMHPDVPDNDVRLLKGRVLHYVAATR